MNTAGGGLDFVAPQILGFTLLGLIGFGFAWLGGRKASNMRLRPWFFWTGSIALGLGLAFLWLLFVILAAMGHSGFGQVFKEAFNVLLTLRNNTAASFFTALVLLLLPIFTGGAALWTWLYRPGNPFDKG